MRSDGDDDDEDDEDVSKMRCVELRQILCLHGFPASGVKSLLTFRLIAHFESLASLESIDADVNDVEIIVSDI